MLLHRAAIGLVVSLMGPLAAAQQPAPPAADGRAAGLARPACAPPAPVRLDSPSVYAMAVIDGLGRARQGILRVPTEGPREVAEVVRAFEAAQDDFACATRYVAPFVRSDSEWIRGTAEILVERFEDVRTTTGQMASTLAGGLPMEEAIQRKDEAMSQLVTAAVLSTRVLVEFREGEPTGRLLVTKTERQGLKAALEKRFGKAIRGGMKVGQDPMTAAAAGWYQVLADTKLRSFDDA